MNKKYKIELTIIIIASVILCTIVLLVRLPQKTNEENIEANLFDQITWSEATEYQIQRKSLGTEIYHQPTGLLMIMPDNWNVKVEPIQDAVQGVSINAWTEGSVFYDNAFLSEGCLADFRIGQAPMRWQRAKDDLELAQTASLESDSSLERISVGKFTGFTRLISSEDGAQTIQSTIPLEEYYLLDVFFRSVERDTGTCWEDFCQALAAAQTK